MWQSWRASWNLAPRDKEVNSGNIEKKRERGRQFLSRREPPLSRSFWASLTRVWSPSWLYILTLHNISAWSYFIYYKCGDWSCGGCVCCELVESNCLFLAWEGSREVVISYFCEGNKVIAVVILTCVSLSITGWMWNSSLQCVFGHVNWLD